MGCRLWGRTELNTTEATQQQQHIKDESGKKVTNMRDTEKVEITESCQNSAMGIYVSFIETHTHK